VRCWGAAPAAGAVAAMIATPLLTSAGTALSGVAAIAAGSGHTCALLTGDGSAVCWGRDNAGQLGDGYDLPSPTPITVLGSTGFKISLLMQVIAGGDRTCAIDGNSHLKCWGDPSQPPGMYFVDGTGEPIGTVVTAAEGVAHGCAVQNNKQVICWGSNAGGQLGNSTVTDSAAFPVPVMATGGSLLSNAVSVVAGAMYSCALLDTGIVSCWGSNSQGQLGNGSRFDSSSPVSVQMTGGGPLTGVVALAAGDAHACAVTEDRALWCWGDNGQGQIGNSSVADALQAVRVTLE